MGGLLKGIGDVVSAPFKAIGDVVKAPIDLLSGKPGQALSDIGSAITAPLSGIVNAGKDVLSDPLSSGIVGGVLGNMLLPGIGGILLGGLLGSGVSQQYQVSQVSKQFQQQQQQNSAQLSQFLQQSGYLPGGQGVAGLNSGLGLL